MVANDSSWQALVGACPSENGSENQRNSGEFFRFVVQGIRVSLAFVQTTPASFRYANEETAIAARVDCMEHVSNNGV
jgi:hypothetical protein